MRNYFCCCIFFIFSSVLFSQNIDPLVEFTDKYWEDQLYTSVTYNVLNRVPENSSSSGFSYGVALGYIKDIPFSTSGKFAAGFGLGYAFDSFNQGIYFDTDKLVHFSKDSNNKMYLHSLDFPIQLRWRNSDAVTYSFWRVYLGTRLSYNLYNSFTSEEVKIKNISAFNSFQTGLELSVGYNSLNFYVYYGLKPIFKNLLINNVPVDTRIAKFGLIFYLL